MEIQNKSLSLNSDFTQRFQMFLVWHYHIFWKCIQQSWIFQSERNQTIPQNIRIHQILVNGEWLSLKNTFRMSPDSQQYHFSFRNRWKWKPSASISWPISCELMAASWKSVLSHPLHPDCRSFTLHGREQTISLELDLPQKISIFICSYHSKEIWATMWFQLKYLSL